jgi:capsular polysaccharide transport system permease protein
MHADSLEDLMLERTNQFLDQPLHPGDDSGHRRSWLKRSLDKLLGFGWLFIATVLIPTSIAIIYFGFLASDVYISESRFVVRSPDKPSASGLGVLLKSAGFSSAGEEVFAAQDYVLSRDALGALNKDGAFARAYGAPAISIFDRFNSLGSDGGFEDLYKYYQKKVKIEHETNSSISTLTVRAYAPTEAQRFNEQLLEMAEATVNRLNQRGRQDLIRFASAEVNDAKAKARNAALALSAYRNREGVVDPEKQATVQLQMISKLQDELIATKTQLLQLRSIAPDNSQIEVLDEKVKALSREIDEQLGMVAGDRKSLAATAAQYQRLALESQFADKQLAGAMASLQDARNEAGRKQAYVERIVQPNLPDSALEPRRFRGILATLALGIVAWGILTMLLAGVKEHQD